MKSYDVKTCSSDLFVDQDKQIILKAPPVKSYFKANLVKLFCWTPADNEARGSSMLNSLGLKTSQILARAIPLNPLSKYRSLLYSQYITGAVNLKDFLRNNPDSPERQELLDQVAKQMNLMLRKGVSFRDFYFGNLLYVDGELSWIDTEIQYYMLRRDKPMKRFMDKSEYMYSRFLFNGGKLEEWDRFSSVILGERLL